MLEKILASYQSYNRIVILLKDYLKKHCFTYFTPGSSSFKSADYLILKLLLFLKQRLIDILDYHIFSYSPAYKNTFVSLSRWDITWCPATSHRTSTSGVQRQSWNDAKLLYRFMYTAFNRYQCHRSCIMFSHGSKIWWKSLNKIVVSEILAVNIQKWRV